MYRLMSRSARAGYTGLHPRCFISLTCYSMSMYSERLQVLIDREQRNRLETVAAERETSVATLVREAIDLAFPARHEVRAAAGARILAAPEMDVPDDVGDLLHELDELRGQRR